TGVVGVLRGSQGRQNTGPTIMIRADMDALPFQEETGLDYASETPGKFHGCGHDGHTTALLGAAKHLATTRNFKGTVYFCFQPAEEGGAGAKAMVDDGLFERYRPDGIYGAHNWPGMPVGMMGVKSGKFLAASQEFEIQITGKGGHGARPHECRDPVVAGAELVMALQTIVSRVVDPVETAVVTVGAFHAGTDATNVIPGSAKLAGTMRSFSNPVMKKMITEMKRICRAVGQAHQVKIEPRFDVMPPYPALVNSAKEADHAMGVAQRLLGEKACIVPPQAMGSEDFAYYLLKDETSGTRVPGCFVMFGNGKSEMLHHPKYNYNDEATPFMVAYWTALVEASLPA
ncbi:MAG: amidohydrolase, partial [Pseudomonadota bacterium]